MESELIIDVAREICAAIDNGVPCEYACTACLRQSERACAAIISEHNSQLNARVRALEVMLLEVMEIAARHEQGEYIERARDLLFETATLLDVVKTASRV